MPAAASNMHRAPNKEFAEDDIERCLQLPLIGRFAVLCRALFDYAQFRNQGAAFEAEQVRGHTFVAIRLLKCLIEKGFFEVCHSPGEIDPVGGDGYRLGHRLDCSQTWPGR